MDICGKWPGTRSGFWRSEVWRTSAVYGSRNYSAPGTKHWPGGHRPAGGGSSPAVMVWIGPLIGAALAGVTYRWLGDER